MNTTEIQTRSAYKCADDCDLTEEEPEGGRYECDNDGAFSAGQAFAEGKSRAHQCPTCGKFAAKLDDLGCNECGGEIEQIEAFVCPGCDGLLETEDEARAHCSEEAVAEREAARERERKLRSTVRVEERPAGTHQALGFCDRCGAGITSSVSFREYIKPNGSFGLTECAEHPVCQTAAETGRHCLRHQGPKTLGEASGTASSIRHGAPDDPCGDQSFVYVSRLNDGTLVMSELPPEDQIPERVKCWLAGQDPEG